MSKRILLVEGVNDKSFYEEFCKAHNLHTDVKVAKPQDLGGTYNSKQGAINHLPVLLSQLADGQIERLALIVDADQTVDGGGFRKTIEKIAEVLKDFHFKPHPDPLPSGGLLFKNTNDLHDFGLWIMPDNCADGILEDWVKKAVHVDEQQLFAHAQATVSGLVAPKFTSLRCVKAEVATWLAWQARPGESLYYVIKGKLLDDKAQLYVGLRTWLEAIFA